MTGKARGSLAQVDRLLRSSVEGDLVKALCLMKYGGQVVSSYARGFSLNVFNVMARENVALARRIVRNRMLGKPRYFPRLRELDRCNLAFCRGICALWGVQLRGRPISTCEET